MKTKILIILTYVGLLNSIPYAFASESQGIQIFQPDVELLPDQKIIYGESFTIHAWLQSYENRPDGLGFYVDVLDPQHKQVDSTLWFAKSDFVYEFDTAHTAYNITQSGTYYVQLEKASFHERIGSFLKTIPFEVLFPEPEQDKFVSDKCGPGTSLEDGICVEKSENESVDAKKWDDPYHADESLRLASEKKFFAEESMGFGSGTGIFDESNFDLTLLIIGLVAGVGSGLGLTVYWRKKI